MKKMRFYLVLVAILSLVLVGCSNSELETAKKEVTEVAALKTDQNVMVFSALSGASALSNTTTTLALAAETGEEVLPEIDMEKANSYLLMMENILADGGPVVATEAESDREGYDMMMVVTVKDLAGNTSSYTIYYSIVVEEEVLPEEETTTPEVEEQPETEKTTPDTEENVTEPVGFKYGKNDHDGDWDDKDDRDDRDEKEDYENHEHHDKAHDQFKNHHHGDKEDEIEYDINALAVIDGVEYEVLGKKEVEEDDEEVEIKFVIKLDDDNYVSIEQEIEEDEIEYQYNVFKGRRMVSSLKFESEEENGKTFVKLSTTNEAGDRETYKFIKDTDVTIVKYECRGYSYTLMVTASEDAEGNIVYDYKVKEREGFNWNHKKGPKGDHKGEPGGKHNI